jgi:hypothetical protein
VVHRHGGKRETEERREPGKPSSRRQLEIAIKPKRIAPTSSPETLQAPNVGEPQIRADLGAFSDCGPSRRASAVAGGSRICSLGITVTDKLSIAVTFNPDCGYVGTSPELRAPVVALSLGGLRAKVGLEFRGSNSTKRVSVGAAALSIRAGLNYLVSAGDHRRWHLKADFFGTNGGS